MARKKEERLNIYLSEKNFVDRAIKEYFDNVENKGDVAKQILYSYISQGNFLSNSSVPKTTPNKDSNYVPKLDTIKVTDYVPKKVTKKDTVKDANEETSSYPIQDTESELMSNEFDDIFGEIVVAEKEEIKEDDALDIFLNSL